MSPNLTRLACMFALMARNMSDRNRCVMCKQSDIVIAVAIVIAKNIKSMNSIKSIKVHRVTKNMLEIPVATVIAMNMHER